MQPFGVFSRLSPSENGSDLTTDRDRGVGAPPSPTSTPPCPWGPRPEPVSSPEPLGAGLAS